MFESKMLLSNMIYPYDIVLEVNPCVSDLDLFAVF